ncbi:epoxide hydrolase 1-like isoform X2 [Hoplias malabaricus]|uniref:epoxide hydrolase 1-like isoform X2 n=1 Tax=Hoplias malabaricus TaxID=27720 RepID=UPI003461C5AA
MQSLVPYKHFISFSSKYGLKLLGLYKAASGLDVGQKCQRRASTIPMGDGWWSREKRPTADDLRIHPFKIETSVEETQDLHTRLDKARLPLPLEDSCFYNGFNLSYLRKVIYYWRNQFDWQKQVNVLNCYPHFKTNIEGFNTLAAARIFLKLMERLGFSQFYLQGGDWGSIIATNMAQIKPDVKGLHLNMIPVTTVNPIILLSLLLGSRFPTLVGFNEKDVKRLYPYIQKNVFSMLRETGYLHIQATKPDTAGCGLNDSPVGLAAYILEKFSSWTDPQNIHLHDGGLERQFSLDDLLTNVMIYWTTSSIVSSMRFYKENFQGNLWKREHTRTGVYVPTGLAAFPEDLLHCPPLWAWQKYKNVVSYSYMPSGGHFAALQEPQLLASDIRQFVTKVEALKK